uniref:Aldehyde dehydrogenase domain-containing protein n=1 Tax=Neovison vison TaxID=452646 RepID=A0A8C7BAN4_NEOVI
MDPYADTLQRLREAFSTGRTRPAEFRAAQLKGTGRSVRPNPAPISPLQSTFEAEVSEIRISESEIDLALRNLRSWMKDEKVPKNLATQLDSAFIRKEPFGLVLIIAPWNYPVNLTLVPLVGALAAGNCVVLKPSEFSRSTEKVLAEVLPRYLDQVSRAWSGPSSCTGVPQDLSSNLSPASFGVCRPQETGQLLEHKFDYIFFTGETLPPCGVLRAGFWLPATGPHGCSPPHQVVKQVLAQTSSGGFCGNDGFMHMTLASLPFGGVGASGMGSYHGKFSFDTFSHHRACLLRHPGLEKIYSIRYPPYSPRNLRMLLVAMEGRSCSCTLL